MARKSEHIIILGTNGTGKSTLLKELVEQANKKGRRALIITPDPVEWQGVEEIEPESQFLRQGGFKGVRKIVYYSEAETLEPISKYYFDGVLIFDDCRSYFGSQTHPVLKTIFIRRRQFMRDVVIVGHGFTDIPPQYFTYTTKFILFKTTDNMVKRKNTISNFEAAQKVVERVNRKAMANPHYKEVLKV